MTAFERLINQRKEIERVCSWCGQKYLIIGGGQKSGMSSKVWIEPDRIVYFFTEGGTPLVEHEILGAHRDAIVIKTGDAGQLVLGFCSQRCFEAFKEEI